MGFFFLYCLWLALHRKLGTDPQVAMQYCLCNLFISRQVAASLEGKGSTHWFEETIEKKKLAVQNLSLSSKVILCDE